jgi:hypothetical protein
MLPKMLKYEGELCLALWLASLNYRSASMVRSMVTYLILLEAVKCIMGRVTEIQSTKGTGFNKPREC